MEIGSGGRGPVSLSGCSADSSTFPTSGLSRVGLVPTRWVTSAERSPVMAGQVRRRPTVKTEWSREARESLQRWSRRHTLPGVGTAQPDRVGLRRGPHQQRGRSPAGHQTVTVSKWRRASQPNPRRLCDAPRPSAARTIDEDVEARVAESLETTPKDAAHWSGGRARISRQTVSEIWRALGLEPWRRDEFKVSPGPRPGGTPCAAGPGSGPDGDEDIELGFARPVRTTLRG